MVEQLKKKLLKIYERIIKDQSFKLDDLLLADQTIDADPLHDFEIKFLIRYCQFNFLGCPFDSQECIICFGEFVVSEKLTKMPFCDHTYHTDCLIAWLEKQNHCPVCRRKTRSSLMCFMRTKHFDENRIELQNLNGQQQVEQNPL